MSQKHLWLTGLLLSGSLLMGCSPKVQVAVPNEPITINLNVKIEHEILVKVDREIDDLLNDKSDLF
ncbi:YnbE family lipoprotein [Neptunomonas concharum]|uniref:YnbE family lipoprotein n=1 Tax=Neptunomonas concharum TaxID=1031538 RepID=A0A5P1RA42_9GAMM|nr:YnbE family lipoprotein [Neptunomonas concharum]QEQ96151.1 YnbE family lipoprotein [Neptunomonas concharum]